MITASIFNLVFGLEWVGLALLAVFIWRKIWPPLNRAMTARAESIRESLEAGDRARAEGERRVEDARARLAAARTEAEALVDQARRSAAQLEEDGRRLAEEEAARIIARSEVEVGLERARVAEQVGREVSEVVLRATDEIVRRELDAVAHRRLLDEAIRAAEDEVVG